MRINKVVIMVMLTLVLLSINTLAEEITVYNSTNFTKPTNLQSPINVAGFNSTQDLPSRGETTASANGKPYLMYKLPAGFTIPQANLSLFENNSNITAILNQTNKTKSFMTTLDENPPLKYGVIIFIVIIVIIVAYIIYLNSGEGRELITFDRDFSPTGSI